MVDFWRILISHLKHICHLIHCSISLWQAAEAGCADLHNLHLIRHHHQAEDDDDAVDAWICIAFCIKGRAKQMRLDGCEITVIVGTMIMVMMSIFRVIMMTMFYDDLWYLARPKIATGSVCHPHHHHHHQHHHNHHLKDSIRTSMPSLSILASWSP